MKDTSQEFNRSEASIEFVEKYYIDDIAESASPESIWSSQWAHYVNGESVLDVACGPQFYDDALAFAKIPQKFVGIDINKANIEFLKHTSHPNIVKAKARLEETGTNVKLLIHDLLIKEPEFVGKFNSVFASGIIGNFNETDTKLALQNIHSYLVQGGQFVMVSWANHYLNPQKLEERTASGWFQVQNLNPNDYGHLISESGFLIEKRDIYKVADPKTYEWEYIFGFVAKKT